MRVSRQVPLPDALSVSRRRKILWVRHGLNRGSLYAALIVACRILPRPAPIVPAAFVRCGGGRFRGLSADLLVPPAGCSGPEEIAATTQRLAEAFEGFVREHPEQWFNFYPFWESEAA